MARRPSGTPKLIDPFDPLDGEPQDQLDLHGFTATEAEARLVSFLASANRKHPGCLVRVITGKGNHSAAGPVLKGRVRTWLAAGRLGSVAKWGLDDADGAYLLRLKGWRR